MVRYPRARMIHFRSYFKSVKNSSRLVLIVSRVYIFACGLLKVMLAVMSADVNLGLNATVFFNSYVNLVINQI